MMMMVVVTMRMVVEVMIEVVVNNIFAQLCFEILSQYDNSLSQDDNSFHTMIILSYKMSILSLPALPLRAFPGPPSDVGRAIPLQDPPTTLGPKKTTHTLTYKMARTCSH